MSVSPITITKDGSAAHLSVDDGRGNALSTAMMESILKALDDVKDANAVLVTGRAKVFCGGLDLAEVVPKDLPQLLTFLELFHNTFRALLALERPVIMAANGSAVAGGAILLCCGDVRLGARDSGLTGVNEARLGLPFPVSALEAVRCALAGPQAHEALLEGRLYAKEDAQRMGFYHALFPTEELLPKAQERLRDLATLPHQATASTKRALRAAHLERVDRDGKASNEMFSRAWASPVAQERLKDVLSKLRR